MSDLNLATLFPDVPSINVVDSQSVDPPSPSHIFTFTHPSTPEASRILPVSYSYGPFRVWRVLAKGGFATAMGAQDVASNRLLCLKVFRKDRLKYRFTKEVLLNELEVYKRISRIPCPETKFIMTLEMSFQTKNNICFAMELMANSLHTYMNHRSAYCVKHACRWTTQMALGINALHEMGIIHRDIKSENILIDVRENVRVADFGLCYVKQGEGPLERERGYTTTVVGTIHCMAPEILHNKDIPGSMKYGAPVDWWALGCVVYELVSKNHKALFETEDDITVYVSLCYNSSDGTSKRLPIFKQFHSNIADLVSGLLQPVPSSRYGFREIADHKAFLLPNGATEFSNAHSRALEREEVPQSLPNLRYGQETHTAPVWFPLRYWEKPRMSNVDLKKPALFSSL
ncbi:kinase-like domain-containing protein [Suillus spraguei]|nr:kinase-like domain-containing protein [Suillus spraguei]